MFYARRGRLTNYLTSFYRTQVNPSALVRSEHFSRNAVHAIFPLEIISPLSPLEKLELYIILAGYGYSYRVIRGSNAIIPHIILILAEREREKAYLIFL